MNGRLALSAAKGRANGRTGSADKDTRARGTLLRIADQRLRNQRLTRPGPHRPEDLVAWMGAVQAQEYGPAKWALALRSRPGTTDAAVERAIEKGRILRTHVLRPTWHFVAAADIRWMLELTAPHVQRTMASYDRLLGLDAGVMTRATGVIERALGEHGHLTRRELGTYLERAGLPGKTRELAHIAMYAELVGVICSGPRRGKQSTYALLAERAPNARSLPRDGALAELTRRYLRSHGPATIRDFVWWSGLKTSDAKLGLEMNRARYHDVDGLRYWTLDRELAATPRAKATLHLLPIYDEYLVAYRDHLVVPRPAYLLGNFQHALVIGGQVAGRWRTSTDRSGLGVRLEMLRPLRSSERRTLDREIQRYSHFLGVPVSLSVA